MNQGRELKVYNQKNLPNGVKSFGVICDKCNKEFFPDLARDTISCGINFIVCPHCDERQDIWIRMVYSADPHHRIPTEDVAGEELARRFHETYERLAPEYGYETREDTKAFDPESPNGKLMIAVCKEITKPTDGETCEDPTCFKTPNCAGTKLVADRVIDKLIERNAEYVSLQTKLDEKDTMINIAKVDLAEKEKCIEKLKEQAVRACKDREMYRQRMEKGIWLLDQCRCSLEQFAGGEPLKAFDRMKKRIESLEAVVKEKDLLLRKAIACIIARGVSSRTQAEETVYTEYGNHVIALDNLKGDK